MNTTPGEQDSINRLSEDQKSTYDTWTATIKFIFCSQTEGVRDKIMEGRIPNVVGDS